ncbi:MAG: pentapeptide repeat-containing protein [Xenococcus sp. (in: cyanobacteria)]
MNIFWRLIQRLQNLFANSNSRDFNLEVVKTFISFLGLFATVFAGIALVFNYYSTQEDQRLTQERLFTDRFSKAVEQLGREKDETVRIGGIYALERIANDSPKDYWTIMEILTSYVRQNSPLPEKEQETKPIDIDVQAALTVIGRLIVTEKNFNELEEGKSIDLTNTNLTEANFTEANLTEANLTRIELYKANLTGANLSKTNLQKASLQEAILKKANLINTDLKGAALLKADLRQANFSATNLIGADLFCANLSQAKNLTTRQVTLAKNWDKAIYDDKFREQLGLSLLSQSKNCRK